MLALPVLALILGTLPVLEIIQARRDARERAASRARFPGKPSPFNRQPWSL